MITTKLSHQPERIENYKPLPSSCPIPSPKSSNSISKPEENIKSFHTEMLATLSMLYENIKEKKEIRLEKDHYIYLGVFVMYICIVMLLYNNFIG